MKPKDCVIKNPCFRKEQGFEYSNFEGSCQYY
jgi:hypothetical protein